MSLCACVFEFAGCVGTERPNGAVDEKHLRILRFAERVNILLVTLDEWVFNEIHVVTRGGEKHSFGDKFWDSVCVNMSCILPRLESRDGR